uniref:Uncharacterized protein n=1 Tax=Craspedostauros australis TaxID=1486917 RepID=A0A7R9WSK2_9STRA
MQSARVLQPHSFPLGDSTQVRLWRQWLVFLLNVLLVLMGPACHQDSRIGTSSCLLSTRMEREGEASDVVGGTWRGCVGVSKPPSPVPHQVHDPSRYAQLTLQDDVKLKPPACAAYSVCTLSGIFLRHFFPGPFASPSSVERNSGKLAHIHANTQT